MNKRHAAIFIFSLMLIGVVWWMKIQVDRFVAMFEDKVEVQSAQDEAKSEPLVKAPIEPEKPKQVEAAIGLQGEAAEIMKQMLIRFNVGDYNAALEMADEAAGRKELGEAFHKWLERQMPALLTSVAWMEIKRGDCDAALGYLQRAYLLSKEEPITKGLAYCHYRRRNWPSTEEFAKQYLKAQPKDAEVLSLYADALESEQRFNDAADQLAKLSELNPRDDDLKSKLDSMREKAKESVRQVALSSRYVELTYRAGEHEEIADFVINTLDQTVEEYIERHGFVVPPDPIEVILYPGESFKSLVSNGPDWAAGIFDGRIRIPIQPQYKTEKGRNALRRILRHELVHAMFAIQTDLRNLPSWFNEGVAQRLECSDRCRNSLFPANPGDFLAAEELNKPYTSFERLKAERSYRQSLYLIFTAESQTEYGASNALYEIISSINKQSDISSDGLLKPLGLDFNKLHVRAAERWSKGDEF